MQTGCRPDEHGRRGSHVQVAMQNDAEEHSNAVEQLFWIDTICVPCSSASGAEKLRGRLLLGLGKSMLRPQKSSYWIKNFVVCRNPQSERLTSGAHARSRSMVPNGLLHYFWTSPAQTLHLALDPTESYLKSVRASSPVLIRTTACTPLPSRFIAYSFCPATKVGVHTPYQMNALRNVKRLALVRASDSR